MATTHSADKTRSLKVVSDFDPQYQCDACGSTDVIETREGYVCRTCGLVLEMQKLEYHRPYDVNIVQNIVLGKTQMGFKSERRRMQHSSRLGRLNRIDASQTTEEAILDAARVEIKRILTALDFPADDLKVILRKFTQIRSKLGKDTKYRSPEMLVPCVVYAYSKENNKPIQERDLLEVSKISKKDFNAFKFSIIRIWPEYQKRDRRQYITNRILEVSEHFNFGMPFYYQSKRILNRFYNAIKNTKDDVIVGLVTSITLLCSQEKIVSVSTICSHLGIRMSTIHRQVENNFIQRFSVPGFVSLVKSADLIRIVMEKLGVLDPEFINLSEISKVKAKYNDIIQVVIGNASPVFNGLNQSEEYYLFVKTSSGHLVASVVKNDNSYTIKCSMIHREKTSLNRKEIKGRREDEIELWKYYTPIGPPLTSCQ